MERGISAPLNHESSKQVRRHYYTASASSAPFPRTASKMALARIGNAVFWKSGQTKIDGLAIDLVEGTFTWGWPRLSESALALFQDEYKLPFLAPALAAPMAAFAEHLFPLLLLLGLATRFSALALLGMTAVIQFLVYPGAYATHGTWAALLLLLMRQGAGAVSLDHWIASLRHTPR